MTIIKTAAGLTIMALLTIIGAGSLIYVSKIRTAEAGIQPEIHQVGFQESFFEAAKVYGRVGCGDQKLAEMTARHAIDSGIPSQLIAAQVATESGCNPLAISNKGAVGLTQVVPKLWQKQFDFSKINLLNSEDNMTVGTTILSKLIKQYGIKNGLLHYYGTGQDDIGMGGIGYANKILQLTGKL